MDESIKKTTSKTEGMVEYLSLIIGTIVGIVVGIILKSLMAFPKGKGVKIDYDEIAHRIAEKLGDSKILTDKREIQDVTDLLKNIPSMLKTGEVQKGREVPENFRQIEGKIDYLYKYLSIKENILELGHFTLAYDDFLLNAEKELQEISKLSGNEYIRRQRMIEFALSMALVYAKTQGDSSSIPHIESLLRKAEELH